MSKNNKIKVFVGMSGGVDSSVSAALLVEAGYDVTGVFIKVWQPDWIECNWKEERLEAMRVAAYLGIPFVTLDLEKEYKEGVIDYMIEEYRLGRTPNPDVMCNREVKFGAFATWAQSQGARFIATGHYAQIGLGRNTNGPSYRMLLCGADANKDQSYFLWTLRQEDLEHIMFPVGHLTKPEVRKLAYKFGLPNADKKDSQGLCFIGKVDVKAFLAHYIETKDGDVLDEHGKVIGRHTGAVFLTIGERHGFDITAKTPNDKPYFVVRKNILNNTITVSNRKDLDTQGGLSTTVKINRMNWIAKVPDIGTKFYARGRYRAELRRCRITTLTADSAEVEFDKPDETLASGQSLVFYTDNSECLGGGILV